jgi:hypothetical protein
VNPNETEDGRFRNSSDSPTGFMGRDYLQVARNPPAYKPLAWNSAATYNIFSGNLSIAFPQEVGRRLIRQNLLKNNGLPARMPAAQSITPT